MQRIVKTIAALGVLAGGFLAWTFDASKRDESTTLAPESASVDDCMPSTELDDACRALKLGQRAIRCESVHAVTNCSRYHAKLRAEARNGQVLCCN